MDDGMNQHGFPRGYHFVPRPLELLRLLDDKLAGRPLPHPLPNIFHDLRIRDFHPAELYEAYKEHEEAGYIYFFSEREFPTLGGRKKRPARGAKSGGWKASGGGKAVRTMRNGAGVDVGQKLTMVFYQRKFERDRDPDKTDWGMHEFTKIVGPNNKLTDTALYRLYKMRSGKENRKADRRAAAATSSGTAKLPASPTVAAVPLPRQTAGGTFMANQASVASTSQAQAQASTGHPRHYHGQGIGTAASTGPSNWVMPATANPPAQLHGAGNVGYVGLTGSPAPVMAPSQPAMAANYRSTSQQQQQATSRFEYAGLAEWHKMLQMVPPPPPPPPPPAPLMASGPATLAHDLTTTQQQAAEHFGYPGLAGWNEQPLKMDLPSPLPAPALATEGYLSDEFNMWCEMQQASSAEVDPWFPMPGDDLPMLTDAEHQKCTFTIDELLGVMDDETVPATMVTEEAGTSNPTPTDGPQVEGSSQ